MPTLLLRLAAPLQSWGSSSKFETRTTESMPSKSGVIGLLAAALGLSRDADLSRLNALRFGVRADRGGEAVKDFHMAHEEEFYTASDSQKKNYVHLTYRYYLSDAVFLAGVEGDEELLRELEAALLNPKFPLFLGRRSCPPTLPIVKGIRELPLEEALREEPPLFEEPPIRKPHERKPHERVMRVQIETDSADGGFVQDAPISFDPRRRTYGYRKVKEFFIEKPDDETEHDAMSELG